MLSQIQLPWRTMSSWFPLWATRMDSGVDLVGAGTATGQRSRLDISRPEPMFLLPGGPIPGFRPAFPGHEV